MWLIANTHHVKGRSLINQCIKRLPLPWRNETNKVDCGIYTMQHMETYVGQCVKDWKIGLQQHADKTL